MHFSMAEELELSTEYNFRKIILLHNQGTIVFFSTAISLLHYTGLLLCKTFHTRK